MKLLFNRINNFRLKIKIHFAGELGRAAIIAKGYGVKFGKNVRLTGLPSFGSEPYLISIGDNVTITDGVIFHNHDGGVGVLREKYPGIDIIKPITIGNNVFVGSHVTIMPGVNIGSNVVIGASSVITKDVPDNVVVAGVPAKVIKTLDQYEEKVLKDAVFIQNRTNPVARKAEILESLKSKKGN